MLSKRIEKNKKTQLDSTCFVSSLECLYFIYTYQYNEEIGRIFTPAVENEPATSMRLCGCLVDVIIQRLRIELETSQVDKARSESVDHTLRVSRLHFTR